MKFPTWVLYIVLAFAAVGVFYMAGATTQSRCPGSYVYCPGVGCLSGSDKCVPGNKGGPAAVFSKEGFEVMKPKPWNADWAAFINPAFHSWPGADIKSSPPDYGKEGFVNRTCPDGTRSDGPCLLDFKTV
jgi:hypothetical protein